MDNLLGVNQEPSTKKRKRCSDCDDREGWEVTKRIKYDKNRDEIVAEWRFFESLMHYEQLRWLYAFVGLLGIASGALDMGIIRVILTDWMHVSCITRWVKRVDILPLTERIYDEEDNPLLYEQIVAHATAGMLATIRQQRDELLAAGCDARRICLMAMNYPFDGLGNYFDYDENSVLRYCEESEMGLLPLTRRYICVDGMDIYLIMSYLAEVTVNDFLQYLVKLRSKGVPPTRSYRCKDIVFPCPREIKL